MLARPSRRPPSAAAPPPVAAGRPRSLRGQALAAAVLALAACAAEPPAAEDEPAAAAQVRSAGLPAELVIPDAGPDRGVLAAAGDHRFRSGAAVRCSTAAGAAGAAVDLRIELDPDDAPQPLVVVTVPAFSGGGDYDGAVSLRLDTADGTFTESTGAARVTLEAVEGGENGAEPGRRLAGRFTAVYAGAAGEGEAAGRFENCALAPPGGPPPGG